MKWLFIFLGVAITAPFLLLGACMLSIIYETRIIAARDWIIETFFTFMERFED